MRRKCSAASPFFAFWKYLSILSVVAIGWKGFAFGQSTVTASARPPVSPPSPSPVVRDPGAVKLLRESVEKLGGVEAIRALPAWTIDATITSQNNATPHAVHFEAAGEEYRIEHRATAGSAPMMVITSGHGKASRKDSGKATPISPIVSHALTIAPMASRTLQRQLDSEYYTIRDMGPTPDGKQEMLLTENHATVLDELVSRQIWYIDKTTLLPAMVVVQVHEPMSTLRHSLMGFSFGNYQNVSGILVPYQSSRLLGDTVVETTTVTGVNFSAVADADFTPTN